jgi:hypothetical protein
MINYGDQYHTMASLTANSDTGIFGDGQCDRLSLNGDENTVTFGNGNRDSATVIGAQDNVTLGNGNQDLVTASGSLLNVTLGDGNRDTVILTNSNESNVYIGNGNGDTATVSGTSNFIYPGTGLGDTLNIVGWGQVYGGNGVTINLTGDPSASPPLATLWLQSDDAMVFLGAGNTNIADDSNGMQLDIGPSVGAVSLRLFGSDLAQGVIDLVGGIGGFATTSAVLSALTPDSSGTGTLLTFAPGSYLDIGGVAPSALTAANFKIG